MQHLTRHLHRRAPRSVYALVVAAALAAALVGCAEDEPTTEAATTTSTAGASTTSTTAVERPDGPSADLSEELTEGGDPFIGSATGLEVPDGYVQHEYVAAGTATDYVAEGELTADGEWTLRTDSTADYRTRVLVRRPEDPAAASGTVIVEWLNVSGGLDANPDYASLEEEIVRQGHTWVGVSAQLIGISGGPVLVAPEGFEDIVGKGLVAIDPERYGTLEHPGDGYAYDIFTQVATAVRAGDPAFGGEAPDVVLAAGESQSAIALTTYYNGVQPLTLAFDGFLVHSRAFAALPLVAPGEYADLAGSMVTTPEPVVLRSDLDAPVLELQAEGDVIGLLNSVAARQDDTDTFRLWEVAGTSHADVHLLGAVADTLDCGVAINDGPLHLVAKAAIRALDTWVRTGEAPPEAPRMEVTEGDDPQNVRDDDGIALGGIRTPLVDVPVDVLSGEPGPSESLICILMGSTTALPDDRIAELYSSSADYEEQFAASADEAIEAGFVLEEDRAALLDYAQPDRIPS